MRITIKDANNQVTVLCDGPERGTDRNVGPLSPGVGTDDDLSIQTAERFRAASVKNWNRLNRKTGKTLIVSREMSSLQAAELWCLQFTRDCIRTGTMIFTETDAQGNQATFTLNDAAIPKIKITPMGVTRQITFTIIGGALV